MNKVREENLHNIVGGADITSAFINSIANIIKLFVDIGNGIGSSIRRITEGNMCPLK